MGRSGSSRGSGSRRFLGRLDSADVATRGLLTFLVVAILFLIPAAAIQSPSPSPQGKGNGGSWINSSLGVPLAGVAIVAMGKPLEGVGLGPGTMASLAGISPVPAGLPVSPQSLVSPKMPVPYPGDIAAYTSPSGLLVKLLL